ncbi:MAG: TIGR01777 family oxidoreductase [Deltaproteobacteria bacterium]|nr:TIGR01777 family oxidoreductase [Deltaproteobacteria bacterium]
MRVLVTGATGFVGRALILRLLGAKDQVAAWVRDENRARGLLGSDVELVSAHANIAEQISRADAIVNLAGEPIFGARWSPARKRAIVDSRVNLTRAIATAISLSASRPAVFISASAVGYYGDRGDEVVDDDTPSGNDFLADLCRHWEAAALDAQKSGVRVFIPRIGIVLGAEEGALTRMVLPFRFGAGGPIGSGSQYVPWIHLDDLVAIIYTALRDERMIGALIAAAPNPATSRQLASAIGGVLRRPSRLPVPRVALELLLGEAAAVLLTGQRVHPRRLQELGFSWRYRQVEAALADILKDHAPAIRNFSEAAPQPSASRDSKYLQNHRPRYLLTQRTQVAAPMEEVFQFFSKPQNLGVMTPSAMRFQILSPMPDKIRRGLRIEYSIRLGPVPLRWCTCIEEWQPPILFADSQESGPYSSWWHEHHFESDGNSTLMEDRVYYSPPLGPAGTIANALFVAPALRRIFSYRSQALRLRFALVRSWSCPGVEKPSTRSSGPPPNLL